VLCLPFSANILDTTLLLMPLLLLYPNAPSSYALQTSLLTLSMPGVTWGQRGLVEPTSGWLPLLLLLVVGCPAVSLANWAHCPAAIRRKRRMLQGALKQLRCNYPSKGGTQPAGKGAYPHVTPGWGPLQRSCVCAPCNILLLFLHATPVYEAQKARASHSLM
jgi:hypothetical protein